MSESIAPQPDDMACTTIDIDIERTIARTQRSIKHMYLTGIVFISLLITASIVVPIALTYLSQQTFENKFEILQKRFKDHKNYELCQDLYNNRLNSYDLFAEKIKNSKNLKSEIYYSDLEKYNFQQDTFAACLDPGKQPTDMPPFTIKGNTIQIHSIFVKNDGYISMKTTSTINTQDQQNTNDEDELKASGFIAKNKSQIITELNNAAKISSGLKDESETNLYNKIQKSKNSITKEILMIAQNDDITYAIRAASASITVLFISIIFTIAKIYSTTLRDRQDVITMLLAAKHNVKEYHIQHHQEQEDSTSKGIFSIITEIFKKKV